MRMTEQTEQKKNRITRADWIAALFTVVLIVITGILFDYYYNLNDDMLMKDLTSGLYTGTPEGHNIQMLFPVSFLLSLPYHLISGFSWYGIFYLVCNYSCIFLIIRRIMQKTHSKWAIASLVALGITFLGAFFLWDLILIQYTVTSAILGSTAIFLFLTNKSLDQTESISSFIKMNLTSIVLVILAFLVRSEMLLLLIPYIGVAGLVKWSREERPFSTLNFKKYFSVIGLMATGILIGFLLNRAAYSSEEWKEFNAFFDNRTQLYDYQKIPPYTGNEEFYQELGLAESQQKLLENYNFGLDEKIDSKIMGEIATYAASIRELNTKQRIVEAVKGYYRQLVKEWKLPDWDVLILGLYGIGLICVFFCKSTLRRKFDHTAAYAILFGIRSIIWIYLHYGERMPLRLTHSVYIAECLILTAFLLNLNEELQDHTYTRVQKSNKMNILVVTVITLLCLVNLRPGMDQLHTEIVRRETVNPEYLALQEYCRDHSDSYFLLDIYSVVNYTEKVFESDEFLIKNYDYMGGWGCKSPLYYDKLKTFQMDTMLNGILENNTVHLISKADSNMDWLKQYLDDMGYQAEIFQTDVIQNQEQDIFHVYQVQTSKNGLE
ncbi:MAG: hypothetical protein PHT21_09080 [Lachnospiraceae bacterium]|nr:hypothetical protein [Lachnospiraceae bacterium]